MGSRLSDGTTRQARSCGGNTFVQVEYADALVDPVKATILAVLDPAPNDQYVALQGGYRAIKVTREHGRATYVGEVRMQGPGFNHRNDIAVSVTWAISQHALWLRPYVYPFIANRQYAQATQVLYMSAPGVCPGVRDVFEDVLSSLGEAPDVALA